MLYTRWGSPVTLVAHCGEHERRSGFSPQRVTLLRVRFRDWPGMPMIEGYHFLHTLLADGGEEEIRTALLGLSSCFLDGPELKTALIVAG